jgi:hypothetical protein
MLASKLTHCQRRRRTASTARAPRRARAQPQNRGGEWDKLLGDEPRFLALQLARRAASISERHGTQLRISSDNLEHGLGLRQIAECLAIPKRKQEVVGNQDAFAS